MKQLGPFFIVPYVILMCVNITLSIYFSAEEIEKIKNIKNINIFMLIILLPYVVSFYFLYILYFIFDLSVKNPFYERKEENELKDQEN